MNMLRRAGLRSALTDYDLHVSVIEILIIYQKLPGPNAQAHAGNTILLSNSGLYDKVELL